jgi:shikimate dehydrogenase
MSGNNCPAVYISTVFCGAPENSSARRHCRNQKGKGRLKPTPIADLLSMTDRYAVFGNPISHSKSPQIHAMFAKETGQTLSYEAILAPLDGFAEAVTTFMATGGRGANVTVPFKEQAFALSDELSDDARIAGAVNTLIKLPDGRLRGDNTDGMGLVADLIRHGVELNAKRVLLVGAGGAARGALLPLIRAGARLTISNRTLSKAEALAALCSEVNIEVVEGNNIRCPFDVIINSTSASLNGDLPALNASAIDNQTVCYDMMYGANATVFNEWAHSLGAKDCIDGLGMLVGQAAESFYLWRKVRPNTAPVLQTLRQSLISGV